MTVENPRTILCIPHFLTNLVSLLKTSNIAGIGNNVYRARLEKQWPEEKSFISVGIPDSRFDDKRTSPRIYFSSAEVNIDILCGGYGNSNPVSHHSLNEGFEMEDFLYQTANAVCSIIENANLKQVFEGSVRRCFLKSITNNLSEQEMTRGEMRIVYGIEFGVCIRNNVPVDEFLKAKNNLTVGPGEANQQEFVTNLRNS